MNSATTAPRLFVPDALSEGAAVRLTPAQAHYLRDVMRLSPGATVRLFNGRDGGWLAEIGSLSKNAATARAAECIQAQRAEPDVWLLFAPIKGPRQDVLVEKAVELGAAALWPVLTARGQVRRVNAERLAAQAAEAAEQCERLSVPEAKPLAGLPAVLAAWPAGRTLFYADETGGGSPAFPAFSAAGAGVPAAILVGPEGGFSPAELDLLAAASFSKGVGLGPRILRAETAAIASLSLWQAAAGDAALPPER
ncbi:16S rRNA (uracil(1498)-N(3))-methyltransferase [Oleispirillum naphthae]|uniref:16S rRNA (uracil(1498)-N(3))-methyltransferase n=1 Tax=Oleispirillum naphthae TaxID=2838853 RepID=UPI0030823494